LFSGKWVLSELNGVPVQLSGTDKDAHLQFEYKERKITGSGGCNRLTGTFETGKKNSFAFGPIAPQKCIARTPI
jgi:heat shock protein HslJ